MSKTKFTVLGESMPDGQFRLVLLRNGVQVETRLFPGDEVGEEQALLEAHTWLQERSGDR